MLTDWEQEHCVLGYRYEETGQGKLGRGWEKEGETCWNVFNALVPSLPIGR